MLVDSILNLALIVEEAGLCFPRALALVMAVGLMVERWRMAPDLK
jgi:hypothetical protein